MPYTLKCQINGGGQNKQGGWKKIPKFNKRGFKKTGDQNLRNGFKRLYSDGKNNNRLSESIKLKYIQKDAIFQ